MGLIIVNYCFESALIVERFCYFSAMKQKFEEVQRFTQWWIWILLIGVCIIPIVGIVQQLILKQPFGSKPMSDTGLLIFALAMFAILGLFAMLKLTTQIDSTGIQMQYFPILKRKAAWHEIESAKVVSYGFVGYGIRFGSKHGIVYNTSGNKGLAIKLKNGKKFLIGTQQSEKIEDIVSNYLNNT